MRYAAIALTVCVYLGVLCMAPVFAEESETDAILMYNAEKRATGAGIGRW